MRGRGRLQSRRWVALLRRNSNDILSAKPEKGPTLQKAKDGAPTNVQGLGGWAENEE